MVTSLLRLPPIPRSPEDIRDEKDLLEWLKLYHHDARDFFSPIALHWTQLLLQTFRKFDITMVL